MITLKLLARLDYDSRDDLRHGIKRMRFVLSLAMCDPDARYRLKRFRTRRGWHVEIYSTVTLDPGQTVALQAILGSDYKREAFNLFRATKLPLAPRFWRYPSHWNILHQEKLADATES